MEAGEHRLSSIYPRKLVTSEGLLFFSQDKVQLCRSVPRNPRKYVVLNAAIIVEGKGEVDEAC